MSTYFHGFLPSPWRSLAQCGRWVLLREVAGKSVEINPAEIIFRDTRVLGSSGVSQALVQQFAGMVSQGLIKPVIRRTLPLTQVDTACELLSNRIILGRVFLDPPQS